jgi:GNAT superfamily N-acetyltransferase
LVHQRTPQVDTHRIASLLQATDRTFHIDLLAERDGAVVAWGCTFLRAGMDGMLFERVVVSDDEEGRGVGSQLHARMLRNLPDGVSRLRGMICDTDQRALDVFGHWGYQRYELCHVSRLEPADRTPPTAVPDLAIEACPELRFADDDVVLAMLDRAETNPERAHGLFVTPTMMRSYAAGGTPVGFLGRVTGAPVGPVHGSVCGDRMLITYLCVDPAFRGRDIALTLKDRLHEEGRRPGATHVITANEHANVAVRSLNTRLGHRRLHGEVGVQHPIGSQPA